MSHTKALSFSVNPKASCWIGALASHAGGDATCTKSPTSSAATEDTRADTSDRARLTGSTGYRSSGTVPVVRIHAARFASCVSANACTVREYRYVPTPAGGEAVDIGPEVRIAAEDDPLFRVILMSFLVYWSSATGTSSASSCPAE